MALYPPIIDNSQTAFVWFGNANPSREFNVYFTFQGLTDGNTEGICDVVLVELQYQGSTLFKTASAYEPFIVTADQGLATGIFKNRYYITITEAMMSKELPPNSVINIRLMALSKDIENIADILGRANTNSWTEKDEWTVDVISNTNTNSRSAWSARTLFSPIYQPTFTTYGALDYNFIMEPNSLYEKDAEESKLSPEITEKPTTGGYKGHYVSSASTYYLKSVLSFDSVNDADFIKEKDYLEGYQIQLEQVLDNEDTQIIEGENSTGYAVDQLVEKTNGIEFIDSYWDPTRRAFRYGFDYDFEDKATSYRLTISYYTNKGYRGTVVYYLFNASIQEEGENSSEPSVSKNLLFSDIQAMRAPEKGSITVICNLKDDSGAPPGDGRLVIQRAELTSPSDEDNYENLHFKTCYSSKISLTWNNQDSLYRTSCSIEDFSAEPGKFYIYTASLSFPFKNPSNKAGYPDSKKLYTQPVVLMIEDMFLSTKDATLKIRYNPDLTSFKRNVVDAITPTLGGAYPFVRRNGAQKYHTFNIGGLISYNSELYELNEHYNMFGYDENGDRYVKPGADSIGSSPAQNEADIFRGSLFVKPEYINSQNYNTWVQQGIITKEDLRVIYEKQFRDLVMDFLYDDKILLFKSQSEGLKFIRLSNVSFTPNKQLDRHIYSFTATATEVLDPTLKNYLDLFMENEMETLNTGYTDIYILTGAYQYDPGAQTLYIGSFDNGGPEDPVTTAAPLLENTWTWNKDEYNWDSVIIGNSNVYLGTVNTTTYDAWGVPISSAGELPTLMPNDGAIDITPTKNSLEFSQFDLLMRELEED